MKIGDWLLATEDVVGAWAYQQKDKIWGWPVRIFIYVLGFLVFQFANLFAQLRWPFSAIVRWIKSFRSIPDGEPIPVNGVGFYKLIQEHQVVLVDFWTEWCGPCIMMEGSLKEFAKQYKEKIVVAKVDATINPKLTKKYNVMGYPTLMVFVEGKEAGRITGALSYKALVKLFGDFLEEKQSLG
jgi:thioredoxin